MRQQKAAFELSMGFIVTVVFAVVLLTLGLVFIQGAFKEINDRTHAMQAAADQEIKAAFEKSGVNFAISPPEITDAKRKDRVSVTVGIKNSAPDAKSHNFAVNIVVENVPSGISKSAVAGWINFVSSPKTIAIDGQDSIPLVITVPSDAKTGDYFFNIVACADITTDGRPSSVSSAGCTPSSPNIWGSSAKTFVMTVKS